MEQVTPFRKTHVWFDESATFVTEPAYQMGRNAERMFLGKYGSHRLTFYNSGWRVKAYQEHLGILIEREEAQDAFLSVSNGTLITAPGMMETYLHRKPDDTETPGVNTGGSTDYAAQSFIATYKSLSAGTDWSTNKLDADETAFPFNGEEYDVIDPTIIVDRVAISTEMDSDDRDIIFILNTYSSISDSPHVVARLGFVGPAGGDSSNPSVSLDYTPTGQYMLSLLGNGQMMLFERLWLSDGTFLFHLRFAAQTHTPHAANSFIVKIIKTSGSCNGRLPPSIEFELASAPLTYPTNSYFSVSTVAHNLAEEIVAQHEAIKYRYVVPGPLAPFNKGIPTQLRMDLRRDVMGALSVAWFTYPEGTFTVDDAPFEVPFTINDTTKPFKFYWTSCVPGTTSVTAKLINDDTGSEFAQIGQFPGPNGELFPIYTPAVGTNRCHVQYSLTVTKQHSPVISAWTLTREGSLDETGNTGWEVGDANHPLSVVREIRIKGAERDISQESATINIADPLNSISELKYRSSMPVRIEVEYDPEDSTKRCTIFKGFAENVEGTRHKSANGEFPVVGWHSYDILCKGQYEILDENFVDTPITKLVDENGNPFRAEDIIQALISRSGYDFTTDFHFPEIGVTVWASDIDYSQTIDMLAKVGDVVQSLAKDYLIHFLHYDANISTHGQWRLIPISTAPYTPVVQFYLEGSGPGKLQSYTPGYNGSLPGAFARNVRYKLKKPEANWVQVCSIGYFSESPQIYCSQPLINVNSYGPTAPLTIVDPISGLTIPNPDYLGRRVPIYVIDPALGSAKDESELSAAVNALARRVARLTFYGLKVLTVEAPLIFIQHELDATRVRPLRYYDPINVTDANGTSIFLVRNVNPMITKDGVQMAMYELEAPRF